MARWLIPLIAICVPPVLFAPSSHWAVIGFVGLLWGGFTAVVLKWSSWSAQRSERRRLIADCEREHAAMLCGGEQDALAYFGRYQPVAEPGLPWPRSIFWCIPPEAFPHLRAKVDA